jgi:cell division protein FtsB
MKNLSKVIDDLGALKAQIAELTAREKAIKDSLVDLKAGAYEGDTFRLTISDSVRETLDMAAVREKLSPQFIAAHTNRTDVRSFKIGARTGKGLA